MRRFLVLGVVFWVLGVGGCGGDSGGTEEGADTTSDVGAGDLAADVDQETRAGDTEEAKPWPELEPVVFAIVSDIHIDGDLESTTPKRVAGLMAKAAASAPAPEFLTITGDLTETIHVPVDLTEGSRMHTLKTILAGVGIPVEGCMGNHDYYSADDLLYEFVEDRDAREELFKQEIGIEPWYYTVHGGTKFIYLSSMHGDRWSESLGLNGSMGAQQLQWLDAELADGKPALLFLHHPPSTVLESGDTTLEDVISQHATNILAVFVGHVHVFAREELAGVPVYVTGAGFRGEAYHHVKVDPAQGTVEILNDVDYGETEEFVCPGAQSAPLPDPGVLEGKVLEIRIPDAHIVPLGLGTYLRDMVAGIPIALKLGPAASGTLSARLTTGSFQGDAEGETPAYIKGVKGADCVAVELALEGACFSSAPVDFRVDLAKLLGLPLPSGWKIRADFQALTLAGQFDEQGNVVGGSLRTKLDLGVGLEDVKEIIVTQYCAGKQTECKPGIKGRPVCPEQPGVAFFDELPVECDVEIAGVGLRMLFAILSSVPDYTVELDANYSTHLAAESATASAGAVDANLFAVTPDGTCPGW